MKNRTPFLCALLVASLAVPAAADLTITTFAGSATERRQTDGPAGVASFKEPFGIASAGGGRFYVPDSYTMRKLAADGSLSTVAGGYTGSALDGIGARGGVDRTGYVAWHSSEVLYFTSGCTVRRIDLAAAHVTTYAGGACGYAEGPGTSAAFFLLKGVAVAPDGTLYVADMGNNVIRKITTDRVTSLYAGSNRVAGHEDGPRLSAAFLSPVDLALDGTGNLYIADLENRRVRKITPGGEVSTLAGQGFCNAPVDGTGAGACLGSLRGVTTDPQGNVYVTDAWGSPVTTYVRRITPAGEVTTLGSVAEEVRGSISFVDGWLYMTALSRATVLRMNAAGAVETHAGRPVPKQGLVNGPRAAAQFAEPTGLDMDSGGNLFIADRLNHAVRKIDVFGNVSTFATGFNDPSDVVVDSSDNVYVADRGDHVIWRITPVGSVSVLAGAAGQAGYVEGTGGAARFSSPEGLGVSGSTIYVADTGNQRIRKINSLGETSLVAAEVPGGQTFGTLQDVVPDGSGNLFVSANERITKVDAAGNITFFTSGWNSQSKIDIDPSGNLWLVYRHGILKVLPNGVKYFEAGAGLDGLVNGTGSDARFTEPDGIAVTPRGIYVGDTFNSVIRHADASIHDRATIDSENGLVGQRRQLGTTHMTASSYEWTIVRRPSLSTATLSAPTWRSPTFTPDVPDLYVFRLVARNANGVTVSEVSLWATYPSPLITSITPDVASVHHPTRVHVHGTNFSASMTVRLNGQFGTVVPFTFVSSTEIVLYAPPPAFAGWAFVDVHVRNLHGNEDQEAKAVYYNDGRVDGSTDFDFDGREELFWRNAVTGANRIWDLDPADPSRIARGAVLPDAPPEWTPAGFADFNGDRHTDVLWRNYHTGANVIWFLRDLQYIGGGVTIDSAHPAMIIVGVGDVNGDGSPDIFWHDYRSSAASPSRIWLMRGHVRTSEKIMQSALFEDIAAVRDFNGDGLVDVLLFPASYSFQQPRIITNVFTAPTYVYLPEVPYDMRPATVGDFDGDGDNDIFWRNRYTGETALWTMNGMAVAGGAYLPTVDDMNMKVVGAAKIGTDARARVLWRNWTTGTNAQWTITGTSVTGTFLQPVDQDWDLLPPR